MRKNIKVLEVAAEGGAITLFGTELDGVWYFSRKVVDQTPALFDEEWLVHHSGCVKTFEAALQLIANYPWHDLHPQVVHPKFQQEVYAAVMQRAKTARRGEPRRIADWQAVCGIVAH